MSKKSLEVFISYLDEPPELDADEDQLEQNLLNALFESSKVEILEAIGNSNFKNIWLTLKDDIKNTTIKHQRIFAEQVLDKIFEIYDFKFSENISLENQDELDDFYNFLEFFEFKNTKFLISIWKFLKPKNLIEIEDIESFCERNSDKIIQEIDEQLEIHPQSQLVVSFLKSCYKKKLIEWFSKNSNQAKIEITINIWKARLK